MKIFKRLFYLVIVCISIIVVWIACNKTSTNELGLTSIEFPGSTITITKGETQFLKVMIGPVEATKDIKKSFFNIESTNPLVAFAQINSVNNRSVIVEVTAVNEGETMLILSARDIDTADSVKIVVKKIDYPTTPIDLPEVDPSLLVNKIELDRKNISLRLGQMDTLRAITTPAGVSDNIVKWESSDTDKVTVTKEGILTAKKVGIAFITAKAGNKNAICEVNVYRTFTVTFNSEGGSTIASQNIKDGSKAVVPDIAPTREGYVFMGWQKDGVAFDFVSTDITENITLKATWLPNGSLDDWDINIEDEDKAIITRYKGVSVNVDFPSFVDEKKVVSIKGKNINGLESGIFGQNSATPNTNIESLDFTQCLFLDKIEDSAFMYCTVLNSIILSLTIDTLGDGVFANCNALEKIILTDSIKYIGERVFENCTQLDIIYFNKQLKYISNRAFARNVSIESLVLPEGLDSIGNDVFMDATSLRKVLLPVSLLSIGESAFSGCSSLDTLTIQRDLPPLTSIQANTFLNTPIANGDMGAIIYYPASTGYTLRQYWTNLGNAQTWVAQ